MEVVRMQKAENKIGKVKKSKYPHKRDIEVK